MTRYLLIALTPATCVFLWAELRNERMKLAIVQAQADAAFERETVDKLLSKGRWVRTWDPATGFSTYRFARAKEQR